MNIEQLTFTGGAKVERTGFCRVCKRALKNPINVALGIGPVCARKQSIGTTTEAKEMPRSQYEKVKTDSQRKIVWIRDLDRLGTMSVTNDAERVVAELNTLHRGHRIIYQDSMKNWDELLHADGKFIGYRPARDMAP